MTPPDISNAEGLSAGPTVPSFSRMLSASELRKMSVRWPSWQVPLPVSVAGWATVISSSNSPKESCAVRRTMDSFTSRETRRPALDSVQNGLLRVIESSSSPAGHHHFRVHLRRLEHYVHRG